MKRMFGYSAALLTLVFLLFLAFEVRAQQKPRVTGFFSDMRYISSQAELVGMEVWIVHAGRYYATVQIAESEPGVPEVVPVEVTGTTVRFAITQSGLVDQNGKSVPNQIKRFEGKVSNTGLVGTFDSHRISLRRRSSYWQ